MSRFVTSGDCPNCPYQGEFSEPSVLNMLWKVGSQLGNAFFNPFSFTGSLMSRDRNATYNGTHWSCPKCGRQLIECNTCHTINIDRTKNIFSEQDCRSCGKRIA